MVWEHLRYRASKFFLTAYSDVRYTTLPAAEAKALLIATPRDAAVHPAGPEVARLSLETSFAGRASRVDLWLDPGDAAALQRLKVRFGKKAYRKTYRFTDRGVHGHRIAPRDAGEAGLPHAQWGKVQTPYYELPEAAECPLVIEPTALFYLVASAPLDVGTKPLAACAFSDKQFYGVTLRAVERVPLKVEYEVEAADGTTRREQGQREVIRIAVEPRSFDPESTAEDFEFLGLEGAVGLYLDPATRIPVQVSGRLPGAGRVEVKLVQAALR